MNKKPRLFYWEEGMNAWCPVPEHTDNLIPIENFGADGETQKLRFKRVDLTDEEMDNLPEE